MNLERMVRTRPPIAGTTQRARSAPVRDRALLEERQAGAVERRLERVPAVASA